MSKLADLKAAAAAKLTGAQSEVSSYVAALESEVSAHKTLLVVVGVGAFVLGVVLARLWG